MFTVLGLAIVFAAVFGGFALGGGPLRVLLQPSELVVIGSAALGTLVAAAPGKMRGRLLGTIVKAFRRRVGLGCRPRITTRCRRANDPSDGFARRRTRPER